MTLDGIIESSRIFQLASNINGFGNWMANRHSIKDLEPIFGGVHPKTTFKPAYRFSITSAVKRRGVPVRFPNIRKVASRGLRTWRCSNSRRAAGRISPRAAPAPQHDNYRSPVPGVHPWKT